MDDHERITHQDLHDELTRIQQAFTEKHANLVKWIATSIVAVIGLGMTQIVSVASSLSEVDGTQELVLQQLGRLDRAVETIQADNRATFADLQHRINDESRESEEDLKEHAREQHNRSEK